MSDLRMHNDCDGGDCAACNWDQRQRLTEEGTVPLTGELIMPGQEIVRGVATLRCAGCDRVLSDELAYVRDDELRCSDCEGEDWQ